MRGVQVRPTRVYAMGDTHLHFARISEAIECLILGIRIEHLSVWYMLPCTCLRCAANSGASRSICLAVALSVCRGGQ